MSKSHLKTELKNRSSRNLTIAAELTEILEYLCVNGHVDGGSSIETKDLVSACPEAKYNRIERLVDLSLVKKISQGADTWIIQTRTGEFLGRGQIRPALDTEITRLQRHLNSDFTAKRVVAGKLRTSPSRVVTELNSGGVWDRRQKLEDAIDAIEDYPGVSKGKYGKIIIRNPPNEYRATRRAETLYRK